MKVSKEEFRNIVLNETRNVLYNLLLQEDVESDGQKIARDYLRTHGLEGEGLLDVYNDITRTFNYVRAPYYTNKNGRKKGTYKWFPGVARMFLNNEFRTEKQITKMNNILRYISNNQEYINKYDSDFGGLSFRQLYKIFQPLLQAETEKNKQMSKEKVYSGNTMYKIVKIETFDKAKKYGKYTDWCVTHEQAYFDSYTNDGAGLFYFLLRKGYSKVKRVVGENAPLDEYGLSMIAVNVGEDGEIQCIVSRWNHNNGGSDNVTTPDKLSEIIGTDVYEVCKPYSDEELISKGKSNWRIKINKVKNNELTLDDIFDAYYIGQNKDKDELFVYSEDNGWNIFETDIFEFEDDWSSNFSLLHATDIVVPKPFAATNHFLAAYSKELSSLTYSHG